MAWLVLALLGGVGLLAVSESSTFGQGPADDGPPTWEYKSIATSTSSSHPDGKLNRYGKDGWELVTSYAYSNGNMTRFVFKRQKQ
jgi:hypothetical protein